MKATLNPCVRGWISLTEFISIQESNTSLVRSNERNAMADSNSAGVVSSVASSDSDQFIYPIHCFCWIDKKPVYFVNNITHPREVKTVSRKQVQEDFRLSTSSQFI